ncbi:DUF58 domain-containing protein [Oleiagrimonas sp. C23AA]|uniref:DUF58 domain-containing protein n=1 Tax=Oleiagrimonas sp. C23AA TaxID=2719047 RepID=UPI00141F663E|nr:DUF58 domain-containing protein [Oleiagrimonas sp. C23AA]NII10309.1 DUF58 domain-containing protein [Oleiagrimonas sp. C23AA]
MSTAARASGRLRQLAERRLPALTRYRQPEALPITLHRRRIYIVPTAYGIGFAAILAVMLVGALNYTNNAALLLTCLLGGTAVNSMLVTFRVLDGVHLDAIDVDPVTAGDDARLRLHLGAAQRGRYALRIDGIEAVEPIDTALPADTAHVVALDLATTQRGWQAMPRLRVSSRWPFGLFRAWSWLHPTQRFLVWPMPEAYGPAPHGHGDADNRSPPESGDEFAALRDYRVGDPRKHIAWKASARHHDLLVRDMEQPRALPGWTLDWHTLHGMEREQRIARLARWVHQAHREGRGWSLRLPDTQMPFDNGAAHFRRCMNALAELP